LLPFLVPPHVSRGIANFPADPIAQHWKAHKDKKQDHGQNQEVYRAVKHGRDSTTWQRPSQRRIVCGVTTYDKDILQQYADFLYRRAKWIIFWTAVGYGLAMFLFSMVSIFVVSALSPPMASAMAGSTSMGLVLTLTVVGILCGIEAGRQKAFNLKLQAQQILCQRQIEINTHSG
jgi:hypothetical protein